MHFSGFADEAASDIAGQIRATQELGWRHFEARNVNERHINDLSDEEFDAVASAIEEAGLRVDCYGSAIANWRKSVRDPFEHTVVEARRAIRRMTHLRTTEIRLMSYGILRDQPSDRQMEEERFRRLRELVAMFAAAGIKALHENCENYGGMGWRFSLRLLENVPGLALVFDTANPATMAARGEPEPWPRQSSWVFYSQVRPRIARVHIKDGIFVRQRPTEIFDEVRYTWPGEGHGDVCRIIGDLLEHGYEGALSIEPHLSKVFHDPRLSSAEDRTFASYIEYGRRVMAIVATQAKKSSAPKPV